MSLKEYEVTVQGRHPHKTTMLLTEADAKRLGATEISASTGKPARKAKAPANKSRAASNKAKPKAAPKVEAPPAPSSVEAASDPDASE